MTELSVAPTEKFDKTNAILAGLVFVISFIVYAMTVQRSLAFWDCGEFIASAFILGIPHPPGTPLFILLGRLFSLVPFVEDISYRMNYISVIGSAATAMFSYLLTVRLVGYFFDKSDTSPLNRIIAYVGGISGGFFVAFSRTNWANSVEAEVYGMALALSVAIVWLTLRYFEQRGTAAAGKSLIIIFYLAMLGIGAHMTVYLVVPACAVFFVLKKDATRRDWLLLSGFIILELFLIILFANGRGGQPAFYMISFLLAVGLLVVLYRKINWAIVLAIGAISSVMVSFSLYTLVTPIALGALIVLAIMARKFGWQLQWRTAMAVLVIGFVGMSVHAFIPIRSELNPRIDENNPSRNWQTFMNFLDRRQYGNVSMTARMFERRGAWSNQFGRHPHMGYWSYFEEQYSRPGWSFIFPFFLLGIIGIVVAIRKRLEVGLPFLTLLLICSVGLILYMNFADGTKYNEFTTDAYLEVRNRDYFFTPAFVFFGVAMGMGISAVMKFLKDRTAAGGESRQRLAVMASAVLVLLPCITLGHNYHACDRSDNYIPYQYATNILDTCEPNAILFTSGDNDTFPVWCVQEVYEYRKDVRVVNLSLLQTDWYTLQMKERFDVPIALTAKQILWNRYTDAAGNEYSRPEEMFHDRARRRKTYLQPGAHSGRIVRVHEMMVDEIVIESLVRDENGLSLKQPIYFSSPPYAESPLKLRDKVVSVGILYKLEMGDSTKTIDVEKGYDLYMNTYQFDGYEDSHVYRDENATGVSYNTGLNATRIFDELLRIGDTTRAKNLANKIMSAYPEYWQMYLVLSDLYGKEGDSSKATQLLTMVHDTLVSFSQSNLENLFYKQDLGLSKVYLGQHIGDQAMIDQGINLMWQAFESNPNSSPCFRKLITVLSQAGQYAEVRRAGQMHWEYKVNRTDPYLRQIMGGPSQGGSVPSGR